MALNLLGLSYRRVPVNLLESEQTADENLARNPQGLVPSLQIDGLLLTQSLAIIDYLNDTRGGLLPADAAGRARVRALAHAIAMEVAPICNLSVRNHVGALVGTPGASDDWVRHYMQKGLTAFEMMLDSPATGAFCHGDSPGMADLVLVPQIYNYERAGLDLDPFPRIAAITARLRALPEIAAAHPDAVKP